MSELVAGLRAPELPDAARSGRPPSVETVGLVKRYAGDLALGGVSLHVEPGSSVALVGPNGAGKTTLLSVIAGLRAASSGRTHIDGEDADRARRRHLARLGVLTHQTWLYDRLTVRENLVLHARLRGIDDDRVSEALAQAELSDVADRQAGACSHGLRKRVALARMMLHEPDTLILDEPFSGLDAAAQERLERLLAGSRGARTVLFSTHDTARAEAHSDRIVGLHAGLVASEGVTRVPVGTARSSPLGRAAAERPADTRSGLAGFLATFWTLLAKDVRIEARSRAISSAMVVFAGLLALTLMIAFQPFAPDPHAVGGVLWVLLAFAALHGLSRGFDEDFRDGALLGVRTTGCDPAAIYLAKVAGISLLLIVVGMIGTLIVAAAFAAPGLIGQLPAVLLVLALAAVGLSAVGAILTVVARHSRMAETLLPIFMLPLSVPVLLAGIELLPTLLTTGTLDSRWIQLLVLYDVGMLGAGSVLFPATLEE